MRKPMISDKVFERAIPEQVRQQIQAIVEEKCRDNPKVSAKALAVEVFRSTSDLLKPYERELVVGALAEQIEGLRKH